LKAVILAGGLGKRLRPFTEEKPKPLLEIAEKPIIVWQIEWLRSYGVNDVLLCLCHLKEKIIDYLGSGNKFGVRIGYVVEDEPLGTGGTLKNAEALLRNDEAFLVLNGDVLTNLNPLRLVNEACDCVGSVALVPLRSPYGIVYLAANRVERFEEKPVLNGYFVNAGVYCFKPQIFEYLPDKGDVERTTFPRLASEGKLRAVKYEDVFWKSIDTYKDLEEAEKSLQSILQASNCGDRMDWRDVCVLVTGGASFIGSHLVDKLVRLGAEVTVVDNLSSGRLENLSDSIEKIRFVKMDLEYCDAEKIKEIFKGIDIVFHLAATHGGRGYIDAHPAEVCSNFAIDHHVFEAACRAGVEKVVFASSACVYPPRLQADVESDYLLREDDSDPFKLDKPLSADIEY